VGQPQGRAAVAQTEAAGGVRGRGAEIGPTEAIRPQLFARNL
jgi:hypothetical protein